MRLIRHETHYEGGQAESSTTVVDSQTQNHTRTLTHLCVTPAFGHRAAGHFSRRGRTRHPGHRQFWTWGWGRGRVTTPATAERPRQNAHTWLLTQKQIHPHARMCTSQPPPGSGHTLVFSVTQRTWRECRQNLEVFFCERFSLSCSREHREQKQIDYLYQTLVVIGFKRWS